MTKNYYIAYTLEDQTNYLDILKRNVGFLAVDTETNSLDTLSCKLMGISISPAEGEAVYFPMHNYTVERDEQNKITNTRLDTIDDHRAFLLRTGLIELLEHSKAKLIMHNSPFDVQVIKQTIGADCLKNLYADTMLLKHTLDERRPHGLKDIAVLIFGEEAKDEQEELKASVIHNGGKWNKDHKDIYMADLDILGKYACADVDLTAKIFGVMHTELEIQGLVNFFYTDEVMPLNEVVIDHMIGRGVMCDIPYFEDLKKTLTAEADQLEKEAHEELKKNYLKHYEALENELLTEAYPLKSRGLLFEQLYINSGLTLYYDKKGETSFVKKVIEAEFKTHPENVLLQWKMGLIQQTELEKLYADLLFTTRQEMYLELGKSKYVINLSSNDQLKDLLFNRLGETPMKVTDKNNAQVDDEVLDHFAKSYSFVAKVSQRRKIIKLVSTYVDGILTSQKEGIVRPRWLQHGTDSGRFSCKEPNFQNLPREDKRIKQGIIARPGYKLIGPDYSQLEPRVFAHYSQEKALIDAYYRGDDFYGTIAVLCMDYKGNPNTMKADGAGDIRQEAKAIALGVAYGMKKWKLGHTLQCELDEAQEKIDKYWKGLPNLYKFVNRCHGEAMKLGYVKTETGRVRRFVGIDKLLKSRVRSDQLLVNKLLNLSINFKIQGTAASIVSRAMIAMRRKFKELNLDAYVLIQIHDEIVVEAREDQAEQVAVIMKDIMENNYKLSLPLVAEPIIADRLSETKE